MIKQQIILCILLLSLIITSGCEKKDQVKRSGYVEGRFTYVTSQTSGTLNQLMVQRGDIIKKNQPLFNLAPNPQLEEVNQAGSLLQHAQAKLADLEKGKRPSEIAAIKAQQQQIISEIAHSEKMLYRYQHLVKKDALHEAALDETIAKNKTLKAKLAEITENLKTARLKARPDEISAAKANVRAAKAALEKAQWTLNQKTIFSPISGLVYDTYYSIGEVVQAHHPVLALLAPKNINVIFFIPQEELALVHIGKKVIVTYDNAEAPITAVINHISSEAEYTPPVIYSEQTRANLIYRIEAKLSDQATKKLNVGQPVSVILSYEKRKKNTIFIRKLTKKLMGN